MFDAFYVVRTDAPKEADREWLPEEKAAADRVKAALTAGQRKPGAESFAVKEWKVIPNPRTSCF